MTLRVFVARHGEAAYESSLCSDDGGGLTPLGRRQARELGARLRGEGIATVWTSPLSRAVQTAELAAAELGVDDVVVREGLREYGVGSLAGTDGSETETIGPVFHRWAEGDETATIPGGERVSDIVARFRRVLEELVDEHPRGSALVVSHGGIVLASVPELAGRPRLSAYAYTLDNGGCFTLTHGTGWRLESDEVHEG